MSDESAGPESQPSQPDQEARVGDMTEEGQTEVGPYPSLTDVENWEESDVKEAAEGDSEA